MAKHLAEPGSDLESASAKVTTTSHYHGVLYGFLPSLAYVLTVLTVLILLNICWCLDGTMGFSKLEQLTPVSASNLLPGPGWLLASRVVCLLATVVPLVISVLFYRKRQLAKGEPLILAGVEILLMSCTLWTWCCKGLYFVLATIASSLYLCLGWIPGPMVSSSLWVLFDISFGMTWLVFWTCWIILIPVAWYTGHNGVVTELLSWKVFYVHNANIVIMLMELVFSSWTVNLEHCIFPVYFGIAYVFVNWWLHSKIHKWIYFVLDYDWPNFMPVCLFLVAIILGSFCSGALVAAALGQVLETVSVQGIFKGGTV